MRETGDHDTNAKAKRRINRRLSAALRENLKRRKAQARARAGGESSQRADKPHDSAGIDADE